MTFTQWIIHQTHREDPIGDLANDVVDDKQWDETEINSCHAAIWHIRKVASDPSDDALTAMVDAWREYQGYATLGDLMLKSKKCCIVLDSFDGICIPVDASLLMAELSEGMEEEYLGDVDGDEDDPELVHQNGWYRVIYDCAEGGTLYFHFQTKRTRDLIDPADVSDVLKGLC